MKSRQVLWNAITTTGQVLDNAVILFFLYRFLIRSIGLDRLGIWSLVLATTSLVTLANQGFSTSVVKFVAKYVARERPSDVSDLLQTAIISVGLALAVLSLGIYPGARWLLRLVLPQARVAEADATLPFAIVSLWINIVCGVLQSGLAGYELITQCNYIDFGGAAGYLLLALWLVPTHGLSGLAYAQVIQAGGCLLATWILLRRRFALLPVFPRRWSRSLFREIAHYGVHFQFITFCQALREPVTKALISKFGGIGLTGIYDLAARWVVTFRELIVQANQVLVPTVSSLQERDPKSIPALYRESYRLMFFLAIPLFAFLVTLSPLVSRFWIGRYDPVFMQFVAILTAGWLVNVLSNPAYVMDLGTGHLRWVSVGCAATALLNATAGILAGKYFGGVGVVAASAQSLLAGYMIILISYHIENRVLFRVLFPRESGLVVCASALGAAIFLPYFRSAASAPSSIRVVASAGIALLAVAGIIATSMWRHPLRKRLIGWVFSRAVA